MKVSCQLLTLPFRRILSQHHSVMLTPIERIKTIFYLVYKRKDRSHVRPLPFRRLAKLDNYFISPLINGKNLSNISLPFPLLLLWIKIISYSLIVIPNCPKISPLWISPLNKINLFNLIFSVSSCIIIYKKQNFRKYPKVVIFVTIFSYFWIKKWLYLLFLGTKKAVLTRNSIG